MTTIAQLSLTRRLIDRYYLFGMACVFLIVSAAVLLSWQNALVELLAIAVTFPLLVLLLGALVLRRTVRVNSAIEAQLRHAAACGSFDEALAPLAEPEPIALAWNSLLEQLRDQRAIESLESRLSGSLNALDQERWSCMFNALGDGLAICDGQLVVVQANNSLAALVNRASADELSNQNILELLSAASDGPSASEALTLLQQGGGQCRDVQLGAGISEGVLRVSRTPLTGDAFGPGTTLWTVRDVTQQRLADEMRSQFLSTATHELRTPLTNIKAYAELLADEPDLDVEKQKTFCNVIHGEASRLSRFVDQLLNVSQMQAGALSLVRHETDVERLIGEVLDNVQPLAVQKHLQFESQIPPKVPKMLIDKDKLAAALVNLLGNAIKYTPDEGRVKLTVEAADQMHFHVEDTGIGIAADELPHISEKFFRSADNRVREINGSGLGLAFVQEVARLHGGRLSIASELNKGSRFTLSLPLT